MKKFIALLLALVMVLGLVACGAKTEAPAPAPETPKTEDKAETPAEVSKHYDIDVAAIDGSLAGVILWIGQEEGIFEDYNVTVNLKTFSNGMVMMEAIDEWDLGLTGVGGILSGMINMGAKLVNVIATDSGTQAIFVRPDSAIVAAGQGKNSLSPEIYGDAESWKGAEVLCTQGNVLQFLLMNVLDGFGLTMEDVEVNWMDMATSNTTFLTGVGDAACVTGSATYADDKAEYVLAATGTMCDLGLTTATLANPDKLADAETFEAMVAYMEAYFAVIEWITNNMEAAEGHMIDWCEWCGQTCTPELAHAYMAAEKNYTLEENYSLLHDEAGDGYSVYMSKAVAILKFYIMNGSYQESDIAKFTTDTVDTSIIDALYNK